MTIKALSPCGVCLILSLVSLSIAPPANAHCKGKHDPATNGGVCPHDDGGGGGDPNSGSAIRLCVDFDHDVRDAAACGPTPCPASVVSDGETSSIGPYQYCDGEDGEHLIDGAGFKVSTTTRNMANRVISFAFTASQASGAPHCAGLLPGSGPERDVDFDPTDPNDPLDPDSDLMDVFFGWAGTEYIAPAGCNPADPFANASFDGSYDHNTELACLEPSPTDSWLELRSMTTGQTRFRAWEMRTADRDSKNPKQSPEHWFRVRFGGDQCPSVDGNPGTLPIAVRCLSDGAEGCEAWRVRTFRGCVQDYSISNGGNWNDAFNGCDINTELHLVVKP